MGLLDFSKAFDKVDHDTLLLKMHVIGIKESLLAWSTSFLQGRTQQVVVDGSISDSPPVLSGVPQGTVLGPLFFLIYIYDILKNLSPGTNVRLFADDSLLYRNITNITDSQILQHDLDTLQSWESRNKMEFHPGKCTVLRFTLKQKPTLFTYKIHGTNLQTQNSAKYLGVTLDSKLNWNKNCLNALVRPLLEYARINPGPT